MKKLADILVEYRNSHELSQRQFAIRCGLSNGYISMLEKGLNPATNKPVVPTLPQIKKLANGMNLTVAELLEMAEDMTIDLGVIPRVEKKERLSVKRYVNCNQISLVARNGTVLTKKLSDDQFEAIYTILLQFPEVSNEHETNTNTSDE